MQYIFGREQVSKAFERIFQKQKEQYNNKQFEILI